MPIAKATSKKTATTTKKSVSKAAKMSAVDDAGEPLAAFLASDLYSYLAGITPARTEAESE